MTTHHQSDHRWIFIILLYLCSIYLPLIISRSDTAESFLQGDSFYYRAVLDSLLNDGDLSLANNVPTDPLNGQLAMGREGFVPKHPILMPLVSLPFYSLLGTPGLLLFNIFNSIILILLIFKLNCLFHSRSIAFITTILYATATLFLDYTYSYSPDVFSTLLLLGGLYFVLQKSFYAGMVLLGLSIFAKLPNAPLVFTILLFAGFMIWREHSEQDNSKEQFRHKLAVTVTAIVIFILALVPYAYTNYKLFGSPIVTGYQRTATADSAGQMLLVDHASKFNQPLLKGMYISLFDPRNGILPTNPVVIMALLGVVRLRSIKPRDKAYLILLLCLIQFVLFAKYDEWYMSHFSNRFLMTFVALSSVFTGSFLSYISQKYSFHDSPPEEVL